MARIPDRVPRDILRVEVPEPPPDELIAPDPPGDPEDHWDPVGIAMLGRWLTRSCLRAHSGSDLGPDE